MFDFEDGKSMMGSSCYTVIVTFVASLYLLMALINQTPSMTSPNALARVEMRCYLLQYLLCSAREETTTRQSPDAARDKL